MALPTFPIKSKLSDIVNFIKLRQKSIIVAPTGYGKSVEIPSGLSENGKKVFVSLPTGLSINSLRHSQSIFHPELKVGILSENEEMLIGANIVYGTAWSIRKKILESKDHDINFCDYLIVDEAHTGNADNYLILGLLNYFKSLGKKVPTVVIMGATISESQFPDVKKEDRFIITLSDISTFKITEIYSTSLFNPKDKRLYQNMAENIISYNKLHSSDRENTPFMAFVPGKKEIGFLEQALLPHIERENITVVSISGSSTADIFKNIFKKSTSGRRKIIITTNVLETAITIEGTLMVFDSMLEKRLDPKRQGWLTTQYISKSSSEQRKGRTGRTSDGFVYKMITKSEYEKLPDYKEEEIYTIDLTHIIVELVTIGIDLLYILPEKVRTKIPEYLNKIKDLGLISLDNELTEMGIFFTEFNLTVEAYSILWWLIQVTNQLFYGIMVTAIINSISQQFYNFDLSDVETLNFEGDYLVKLNRHKEKYYQKYLGRSELHTLLNLFIEYFSKTADQINNKNFIRDWSTENKLEYKTVRRVINTFQDIISVLSKNRYSVPIPETAETSDTILDFMRPILRRVYKNKELMLDKEKGSSRYISVNSGEDGNVYKFSSIYEFNQYSISPPARILVIKDKVIPDKSLSKSRHFIEVSLNIEDYQLSDRVVTKTDLLLNYEIKLPKKYYIRTKGEVLSPDLIHVPIDYTKVVESYTAVPKMVEELYIPIGKTRLITVLNRNKK